MSLVRIAIVLFIVGGGLWAVNEYAPVIPAVKATISAVLVGLLCWWLLWSLDVIGGFKSIWVSSGQAPSTEKRTARLDG